MTSAPELVPLGRNCLNPKCNKPLFAKKIASAKEYCDSRCRTIGWALKELAKEGKS